MHFCPPVAPVLDRLDQPERPIGKNLSWQESEMIHHKREERERERCLYNFSLCVWRLFWYKQSVPRTPAAERSADGWPTIFRFEATTTKQERTLLLLLLLVDDLWTATRPGAVMNHLWTQSIVHPFFFFASSLLLLLPIRPLYFQLISLYTFFFFFFFFLKLNFIVYKEPMVGHAPASACCWCCPCYCYSNWKDDETLLSFLSCFLVVRVPPGRRKRGEEKVGISLYTPIYGDQVHLWRPFSL